MSQLHIIGAGLSGLSAAIRAAQLGHEVSVREAEPAFGGRFRATPLHDRVWPVIYGGDHAVDGLLRLTGAQDLWQVADPAVTFTEKDQRWRYRPGTGKSWVLNPARHPPGVTPWHYLELYKLATAGPDEVVSEVLRFSGESYGKIWGPMCRLWLNTPPNDAAPRLFWNSVKNHLFRQGGSFARTPKTTLQDALIAPCLAWLRQQGAHLHADRPLSGLEFRADRVVGLFFGSDHVEIGPDDGVILGVPPRRLAEFLPETGMAQRMSAAILVHFDMPQTTGRQTCGLTARIDGSGCWFLCRDHRLTVLFPAARTLISWNEQALIDLAWREAKAALAPEGDQPQAVVIKRHRYGLYHSAGAEQTRGSLPCPWYNLTIADPLTLPGVADGPDAAIRAGTQAADSLTAKMLNRD